MDAMEERRKEIVSLVNNKKEVSFNELKDNFPNVSDMTLRTDLKYLDSKRRIIRIHGGAKSIDTVAGNDDYLSRRFTKNIEGKKIIAKKAVEYVHEHAVIFLDSGSSTTYMAQQIPDMNLSVYTSGLTCAVELAKHKNINVRIGGGHVNGNSLSVVGAQSQECYQNVNFETAFLGVTKYSSRCGFTCESYDDAELKRMILKHCKVVVVLMDSTKVNQDGTYTFANLDDIDYIISDSQLPQSFIEECDKKGVTII